ncbi:DMP19 family protein [Pseudomonas triticifolii]|uniref:DMP19 family protein n=1 Tax=Pseudomonas triticifolii TaxID=2762592 RepID=A0ABR7B8N7_9PSED|nr:DMP19 family protein [Pseudomonas triticifolii]MBC3953547.1 DMP19 family protein [Pseudomonas triticifolii]
MSEKQPCRMCENLILATTAARNDGMCMPCKGGYRERIEDGKLRAEDRKHYIASPQALYWSALVNRVYDTPEGFSGLALAEQRYYAVSVLQGEVYNGGFDQYFGNSSGEHYADACAGLLELGATQTLALLEEARRLLFGTQPVPSDQGLRQLSMPTYADDPDLECEAALDALDTQFYRNTEQLDERLLTYARKHRLFDMEAD